MRGTSGPVSSSSRVVVSLTLTLAGLFLSGRGQLTNKSGEFLMQLVARTGWMAEVRPGVPLV